MSINQPGKEKVVKVFSFTFVNKNKNLSTIDIV